MVFARDMWRGANDLLQAKVAYEAAIAARQALVESGKASQYGLGKLSRMALSVGGAADSAGNVVTGYATPNFCGEQVAVSNPGYASWDKDAVLVTVGGIPMRLWDACHGACRVVLSVDQLLY